MRDNFPCIYHVFACLKYLLNISSFDEEPVIWYENHFVIASACLGSLLLNLINWEFQPVITFLAETDTVFVMDCLLEDAHIGNGFGRQTQCLYLERKSDGLLSLMKESGFVSSGFLSSNKAVYMSRYHVALCVWPGGPSAVTLASAILVRNKLSLFADLECCLLIASINTMAR